MKKCHFCAEEIQDEAIKCKHCGGMLIETIICSHCGEESSKGEFCDKCGWQLHPKKKTEVEFVKYKVNIIAIEQKVKFYNFSRYLLFILVIITAIYGECQRLKISLSDFQWYF